MYLSPDEYWKHLAELFPNGGKAFTDFLLARHRYPDITVFMHGPGGPIYCSETVNQFCTDVEFVWDGKLVLAFPYITENEMRIYSNPCVFAVGWSNTNGFGLIPMEDTLQEMTESDLSDEAVDLVEDYLVARPPINW